MRGWLVRIGIIAAVVVVGLVARPWLSGNAGDLSVGDCFDVPAGSTATVRDVQHHPCSDSHGGEVVFVGELAGANDAYPSQSDVVSYVAANCVPAYEAYTGLSFQAQQDWDIGWFSPTEEGWKKGERSVSCYTYRVDDTTTKGSVRKE